LCSIVNPPNVAVTLDDFYPRCHRAQEAIVPSRILCIQQLPEKQVLLLLLTADWLKSLTPLSVHVS